MHVRGRLLLGRLRYIYVRRAAKAAVNGTQTLEVCEQVFAHASVLARVFLTNTVVSLSLTVEFPLYRTKREKFVKIMIKLLK